MSVIVKYAALERTINHGFTVMEVADATAKEPAGDPSVYNCSGRVLGQKSYLFANKSSKYHEEVPSSWLNDENN